MSFSDTAIHILTAGKKDRSGTGLQADDFICNRHFILLIRHIQALKRFMLEEKLSFSRDDLELMDLGRLNNARYRASGRAPTDAEWAKLDSIFSAAASHLRSPDLKRKVRIRELGVFFGRIPLIFLFTAVASTSIYLVMPSLFQKTPIYWAAVSILIIIWSLSQGGLGACAFLGTSVITSLGASAVAKNADDTVKAQSTPGDNFRESNMSCGLADVTDRNFLKIRIILGALFGFLLGLPISHLALHIIFNAVNNSNWPDNKFPNTVGVSPENIALMIMPFAIGFSTNTVLVLFSRFISVIQALFQVPAR